MPNNGVDTILFENAFSGASRFHVHMFVRVFCKPQLSYIWALRPFWLQIKWIHAYFCKINRDNRPSMRKEFKRKPVSLHSFCSNPLCVCLVRTASAPLSHRYTFALHQPPRLPGHLSLFHQMEGSEEDQLLAFEKYCLQVGACLS